MPSVAVTGGTGLEDNADQALTFIDGEIPAIEAVSVMLNQRQDAAGNLYDVMDVGWRIIPLPNVYYSHPKATPDWPNVAVGEIILKADKVLSIYAGLQERADFIALPPDWGTVH